MQSHTIPSGRPAPRASLAGTSIATVAAILGVLVLLGVEPSIVALIAIVALGSILILADPSIEDKAPHTPLV